MSVANKPYNKVGRPHKIDVTMSDTYTHHHKIN